MKDKLRIARKKCGLSQENIADLTGMSQSNYSRRENGLVTISDNEWKKIAYALKVNIVDIYETNSIKKKSNNMSDISTFNIPNFILEHIEFLKTENTKLKNELKNCQNQ
jgi:transcriptional regulator with XRE-family HTH domain